MSETGDEVIDPIRAREMSDEALVSEYRSRLEKHAMPEEKKMVRLLEVRNLADEMLQRRMTNEDLNE